MITKPEQSLTVWIFQTGEPLPVDEGMSRPMRAMNLAHALVNAGHKVVIWSSAFYHQKKIHRTKSYKRIEINPSLEVRLIPSKGYQRNIGFGRLLDHIQLGCNLRQQLKWANELPDVAFIGYPPVEFAAVAASCMKANRIPSFLDAKDQWPQIFIEHFPTLLRPIACLIFFPYFYLGRKAMRNATALCSMSESFLNWMRDFSGRDAHDFDGVYPLTSFQDVYTHEQIGTALDWWREIGVKDDGRKRFFFVGSLSQAFDFTAIADAAKRAEANRQNWQFVICGDGGDVDQVRALFTGLSNVIMPGWVDRPRIIALSKMSYAGLAPYRNIANFRDNIPNKIIDYLSFGQPIITQLQGEVERLLTQNNVGLIYEDMTKSSLYQVLMGLCDSTDIRNSMAEKAFELYQSRFSGEMVYAALTHRLEQLARNKPKLS